MSPSPQCLLTGPFDENIFMTPASLAKVPHKFCFSADFTGSSHSCPKCFWTQCLVNGFDIDPEMELIWGGKSMIHECHEFMIHELSEVSLWPWPWPDQNLMVNHHDPSESESDDGSWWDSVRLKSDEAFSKESCILLQCQQAVCLPPASLNVFLCKLQMLLCSKNVLALLQRVVT